MIASCQSQQQTTSVESVNWMTCGVDLSAAAVEGEEQLVLLQDLLRRNVDVFSKHSMGYGHTTTVQQ